MIHTSYSSFAMAGGEDWGLVVGGRSLGYQTDGSTATELLSHAGLALARCRFTRGLPALGEA
jgi:hypothetical protein